MVYFSAIFRFPQNMWSTVWSLNSVDLFMAIIVVAIIFTQKDDGIVAGIVKLFGVLCTIFFTLHYYARLADFLRVQFFSKETSTEFFAFSLLAVSIFLIFIFINRTCTLILKIKSFSMIDHWGSRALSLIRSYFICSLIFVALILSGHKNATKQAQQSVSRFVLKAAAVDFYKTTYFSLIKKTFPDEKINEDVYRLVAGKPEEKSKL